jgi:hypothetical protein
LIYKGIFWRAEAKTRKKPGPFGTGLLSFMVGVAGFKFHPESRAIACKLPE